MDLVLLSSEAMVSQVDWLVGWLVDWLVGSFHLVKLSSELTWQALARLIAKSQNVRRILIQILLSNSDEI